LKTPQLLELSGIGDRTILEKAGVPVKLHLPGVGANAQGTSRYS
jgi:choline dehydrogenase